MDKLFIKLVKGEATGYTKSNWGQTYVNIVFTDDKDQFITKKVSKSSPDMTWNELFEM